LNNEVQLVSFRLALDHLPPAAPAHVVFLSVADSGTAADQAAALGCGAVERLEAHSATATQVQACGLQAAAWHAARRHAPPPLMVGYVMKQSRQLALSQQGLLPLLPSPPPPGKAAAGAAAVAAAGERPLCFFPLDLGSSLPRQLQRCHVVLQKLTDCLQPSSNGAGGAVPPLTAAAAALLAALEGDPQQDVQQQQQQEQQQRAGVVPSVPVCLVDPAPALQPIMDRWQLVGHLAAVVAAVRQQGIPMRAPASALLRGCSAAATPRELAAAGVPLPCIVKPRAACGVAEAHQMAFVLHG
jgi:hypothetical protein